MKVQYKDKEFEISNNITIEELLKDEIEKNENCVIAATFNNKYVSLSYEIRKDGRVTLLDTSMKEGTKVYRRTLIYIMVKAFEKLYPEAKVRVNYQLPNSMYCEVDNLDVTDEVINNINNEMRDCVKRDLEIRQVIMNRQEAEKFYNETNTTKGRLQLDLPDNNEIYLYYCEDYYNYCYGTLANRTGLTKIFEVVKFEGGFLLRYPSSDNPNSMPKLIKTKKLLWALNEYEDIHQILDMETVHRLNEAVENDNIKDVIMLDEALHEKKIANIADEIAKRKKVKMVLIAGPSSSGKTTFAQRLGIQLRINGIKPVTISVDNYFVERKETPRDENGEYDFECLEAIDLELFNDHLTKLLNGEEVEIPKFDFKEGTKRYEGNKIKLKDDEILVIEGIHCLNDKLTKKISKEQKYKIYISALTVLNMDRYNRISTTDTRLIRRIVRDSKFRGYSAKHTIKSWYKVNKGEVLYIFPYQEEADSIFNTSLIYELGVLEGAVMPLLEEITKDEIEFAEARRLKNILKYIREIPEEYVPTNSLLKEFLGGGNFKY